MAVVQSLRENDVSTQFLNIDYHRYGWGFLSQYFGSRRFDIVGISSVVSTAYAYTKQLAALIRNVSPTTRIVVGGNLAASAEILLRKAEVDLCVTGDGEETMVELVSGLQEKGWSVSTLEAIKGLAFLDGSTFRFTGHRTPPEASSIVWPDYSILEEDQSLNHFLETEPWWLEGSGDADTDQRSRNAMTIITTKGCVARCTFCHRFEKGYRMRPADQVVGHVSYLVEHFGVGFIDIGDENFGSNKQLTREIANALGKLGVIWRAGGVRTRSVSPEILREWQANGCRSVIFGVESGSQEILDIMQKNATVLQNEQALRWTVEAGMETTLQLVIGMPGESPMTIRETTEFCKRISAQVAPPRALPSAGMSINYAQALPGTPLYEYARARGLIAASLEDEEEYLLSISDTDAYSTDNFVNFTGYPLLEVLSWRRRLIGEVDWEFISNTLGVKLPLSELVRSLMFLMIRGVNQLSCRDKNLIQFKSPLAEKLNVMVNLDGSDSMGYFNVHSGWHFALLWDRRLRFIRSPLIIVVTWFETLRVGRKRRHLLAEYTSWILKGRRSRGVSPTDSLRRELASVGGPMVSDSSPEMLPLRLGR